MAAAPLAAKNSCVLESRWCHGDTQTVYDYDALPVTSLMFTQFTLLYVTFVYSSILFRSSSILFTCNRASSCSVPALASEGVAANERLANHCGPEICGLSSSPPNKEDVEDWSRLFELLKVIDCPLGLLWFRILIFSTDWMTILSVNNLDHNCNEGLQHTWDSIAHANHGGQGEINSVKQLKIIELWIQLSNWKLWISSTSKSNSAPWLNGQRVVPVLWVWEVN